MTVKLHVLIPICCGERFILSHLWPGALDLINIGKWLKSIAQPFWKGIFRSLKDMFDRSTLVPRLGTSSVTARMSQSRSEMPTPVFPGGSSCGSLDFGVQPASLPLHPQRHPLLHWPTVTRSVLFCYGPGPNLTYCSVHLGSKTSCFTGPTVPWIFGTLLARGTLLWCSKPFVPRDPSTETKASKSPDLFQPLTFRRPIPLRTPEDATYVSGSFTLLQLKALVLLTVRRLWILQAASKPWPWYLGSALQKCPAFWTLKGRSEASPGRKRLASTDLVLNAGRATWKVVDVTFMLCSLKLQQDGFCRSNSVAASWSLSSRTEGRC